VTLEAIAHVFGLTPLRSWKGDAIALCNCLRAEIMERPELQRPYVTYCDPEEIRRLPRELCLILAGGSPRDGHVP
jgi:hypothetical protein